MSATVGKFVLLYADTALSEPSAITDGGDMLPLLNLDGGPDRLIIKMSADAPTVLTDVISWILQDSLWTKLAITGGGPIMFASLNVDIKPVQFEIEKPGRPTRLAFQAALDVANTVTIEAARGTNV